MFKRWKAWLGLGLALGLALVLGLMLFLLTGAARDGEINAANSVTDRYRTTIAAVDDLGFSSTNKGALRTVSYSWPIYSASTTAKTATAAGTAPFASIYGSATKLIHIRRITVSGSVASAAVYGDVVVAKRTAALSSGTATSLTAIPFNTDSAAGTAVPKYWTVLPTAGTGGGVIASQSAFFPVTGTPALGTGTVVFDWTNSANGGPILDGTAEGLEVSFGTTTTNAPTLCVTIEWDERDSADLP